MITKNRLLYKLFLVLFYVLLWSCTRPKDKVNSETSTLHLAHYVQLFGRPLLLSNNSPTKNYVRACVLSSSGMVCAEHWELLTGEVQAYRIRGVQDSFSSVRVSGENYPGWLKYYADSSQHIRNNDILQKGGFDSVGLIERVDSLNNSYYYLLTDSTRIGTLSKEILEL